MNLVYLSLGSNLGEREANITAAIAQISLLAGIVSKVSPLYETEGWGESRQNSYLNCCILLETNTDDTRLIHLLLGIEKNAGRERNVDLIYSPRKIDIDILFFNSAIIDEKNLTVPHPRLHLRKFVLVPLNDITPQYLHPVLNKTIFNLLSVCRDDLPVKFYK